MESNVASVGVAHEVTVEWRRGEREAWEVGSLRIALVHQHGKAASSTLERTLDPSSPAVAVAASNVGIDGASAPPRTLVQLTVVDADDSVAFETPVVAPLSGQVDLARFFKERIIVVYDESNDHGVCVKFSSREEGQRCLSVLVGGSLLDRGDASHASSLPSISSTSRLLLLNEDDVRRQPCPLDVMQAAAVTAVDVATQLERVVLISLPNLDVHRDVDVVPIEMQRHVYVTNTNAQQTDALTAFFTTAHVGSIVLIAFEAAHLKSVAEGSCGAWVPQQTLQTDPSGHMDGIFVVTLTVKEISASQDDPKKEAIMRRLQRQGAHTALGSSGTLAKTPNSSFAAVNPPSTEVGRQGSSASLPATVPAEALKVKKKKRDPAYEADQTPESKSIEQQQPADDAEPESKPSGESDETTEAKWQAKWERRRQRMQRLEAELLQQREDIEMQQRRNEAQLADITAGRAALEAERQRLAAVEQRLQATAQELQQQQQQQQDVPSKSSSVTRRQAQQQSMSSPTRSVGTAGGVAEREPLMQRQNPSSIAYTSLQCGSDHNTYVLRIEHPFYDNSTLPPAVVRCYPAAAAFIGVAFHPAGVALFAALLVAGISMLSYGIVAQRDPDSFWPLVALLGAALGLHILGWKQKGVWYDGLHRLDQSCAQFDAVAFVYHRKSLFTLLPAAVLVACVAPVALITETSLSVFTRVGVILGGAACVAVFGAFCVFLMMVASVAWDRVGAIVPTDGVSLASRLALRRVAAQYQFVKALVAQVSLGWASSILCVLFVLFAVMFYCVYACIETTSFERLLAYNVLFAVAACFSFTVLRAVCGWQGATMAAVGAVTVHCDRWCRGDYNAEGTDLRLEDFVALQQTLVLATMGSQYAKWSMHPMENLGRLWMWSCGALALVSIVMIPVTVLYRIDSWDA